MLSWFWRNKII